MAKKSVDLTSQEWRNLVFAGKNQDFGAYQLRKQSDKRHNMAFLYMLMGLVVIFILIIALSKYSCRAGCHSSSGTTREDDGGPDHSGRGSAGRARS